MVLTHQYDSASTGTSQADERDPSIALAALSTRRKAIEGDPSQHRFEPLALDEIDAALAKGFSDYDALRRDPDLENLRRSPEFRKVLEKHKVFIVR